ncbi:MAG: flippase-like domain-containing protein [Chloroflexi bacterium]|nr:flippase-like domain-containing protein [Chloroflexota bacterium]
MLDTSAAKEVSTYEPPVVEESGAGDISLGRRLLDVKTLVSFAIAFGLLYLLFRNVQIDLAATWQTIKRANLFFYFIGFALYYSGFLLRGWRWQRMLDNAHNGTDDGQRRGSAFHLGQIVYLSWFFNCLVPAKLGDVVRAYMLRRDLNVRFLKAMGTILAERLLDLGVLLVLLSAAALVSLHQVLPDDLARALELGFVLVAVGVLGLLALHRLDDVVQRLLPERFRERYSRFYEGILRSFHSLPFILPLTVLIWLTEAGRLAFVTWSLGLRIDNNPVTEALMLMFIALAAAALTALPVTPGGLGLVEALMVKAFSWGAAASGVAIANELAWSIAILDRSISYGSIVIVGFIVYFLNQRRQRR